MKTIDPMPISGGTLALLLSVVVLLAIGQVLFKHASGSIQISQPQSFFSVPMLVALVVYAIATAGWIAVLSRTPLSVAFPVYGLTFLLVPVLAWAFLAEPLRFQSIVGGLVIVVGIIICSR